MFTQSSPWWLWLKRQHILVRLLAGLIGLVFVTAVVWASLRYSLGLRSLDDVWDFLVS